ncbi:MAG: alpha-D-ribose 1-methylphosphonate 5-triphosphate diphosphatase [Rhodobacteraceae bacterium]|nr:alpha-D-ribose 1-methylphosphonate 5-triphosphate diphosphatase [Paracoccaceae bacterium]
MSALAFDLSADILLPDQGVVPATLSIAGGVVVADTVGRPVDLSGYLVLPGIVDLHGDGFERHLAPRRGAMKQMAEGVFAVEAELAANGMTTAVMAQFYSWEGGLRSPEYAADVFTAIRQVRPDVVTDLIPQLRFETNLLDDYEDLPAKVAEWQVQYVVFNDHLPHERLAAGKRPPRLTGQALKAGRNPEKHLEMLKQLHARSGEVPKALDGLTQQLLAAGVRLGSHDDNSAEQRRVWHGRGVEIAEFPETIEAAEAARDTGDQVILGAPNVVRGGSHKGNANAVEIVAMGLCNALASDYHYPSPRRAALLLAASGVVDFATAWGLVSSGPAQVLGLSDRGSFKAGSRADLVVLEADSKRVVATMAAGRFSFLSGDVATRFF